MEHKEHIPVLATEVIESLALVPGARVCDGTVGLGGHAALILAATSPNGELIAFDRDGDNLATAQENLAQFAPRVTFIHDSFGNVAYNDVGMFDAALLDLGFSSVHVDDPSRGFSFMQDGPLDMRYDVQKGITAADVVNTWSKDELATVFRRYGEELQSERIAKTITEARKAKRITSTAELAAIVSTIIPRRGKIHPATKVFQALRIVVNDELKEVERGLKGLLAALKPGGRLAVITFHSLEDRIVKVWGKEHKELLPLTKKPITATREEVKSNPRARSAKLRTFQKL